MRERGGENGEKVGVWGCIYEREERGHRVEGRESERGREREEEERERGRETDKQRQST